MRLDSRAGTRARRSPTSAGRARLPPAAVVRAEGARVTLDASSAHRRLDPRRRARRRHVDRRHALRRARHGRRRRARRSGQHRRGPRICRSDSTGASRPTAAGWIAGAAARDRARESHVPDLRRHSGRQDAVTVTVASDDGWHLAGVHGGTVDVDVVADCVADRGLDAVVTPDAAGHRRIAHAVMDRAGQPPPIDAARAARADGRAAFGGPATGPPRLGRAQATPSARRSHRQAQGRDRIRARARRHEEIAMPNIGQFVLHSMANPPLKAGDYTLHGHVGYRRRPDGRLRRPHPRDVAALRAAARPDAVDVSAREQRGRVREPPAADRAEAPHAAVGAIRPRRATRRRRGSRSSSSPRAKPRSRATCRSRSA